MIHEREVEMGWFSKVVDAVKGAAGATADTVSDAADAVGDAVTDAAGAVGDAVTDAAGAVGDAVTDAADVVGDTAAEAGGALRDMAGDAATWMGDAAGKAYDVVTDVGYELLDPGSTIRDAGAIGSRIVGATGDVAAKGIEETLGASILPDAIEGIGDKLADTVDATTDLTQEAIEGTSEVSGSVADLGTDVASGGADAGYIWDETKEAAGEGWDSTAGAAGDVWEATKDAGIAAGTAAGDAATFMGEAAAAVAGAAARVYSSAPDSAEEASESVSEAGGGDTVARDRLGGVGEESVQGRVERVGGMTRAGTPSDSGDSVSTDQTSGTEDGSRSVDTTGHGGARPGPGAGIEDPVPPDSSDSVSAPDGGEADTAKMLLEGFTVRAAADLASEAQDDGGYRTIGAESPATPPTHVLWHDEPSGVDSGAEVRADGFAGFRPGGGVDDAGESTAEPFSEGRDEEPPATSGGAGRPGGLTGATPEPAPGVFDSSADSGLDVTAGTGVGEVSHGWPDGGDDHADDLSADFLGGAAQPTLEPGEGSGLHEEASQPHVIPFEEPEAGGFGEISIQTDGLADAGDDLDGIPDEDPDDDGIDL